MRGALTRVFFALLWAVALPAFAASAGPTFPALTGRVVDEAGMLSPRTRAALDQALGDYERGTGNQVVVATVRSLQGYSIEEYGVGLGRKWGIGQKGKDNGALLIVAPHERKVRIEVGYGLEPLLTDARSSEIVRNVIIPDFRAGKMEQGVVEGTRAMLDTLGGKSVAAQEAPHASSVLYSLCMFALFLWIFGVARRHPYLAAGMLASSVSRFGSSGIGSGWGGSGGGGFSGGGGSFGGGGSSGGW